MRKDTADFDGLVQMIVALDGDQRKRAIVRLGSAHLPELYRRQNSTKSATTEVRPAAVEEPQTFMGLPLIIDRANPQALMVEVDA